jgi:hypothetical protein
MAEPCCPTDKIDARTGVQAWKADTRVLGMGLTLKSCRLGGGGAVLVFEPGEDLTRCEGIELELGRDI